MEPSQKVPPLSGTLPIQNNSINYNGEGISKFPSESYNIPSPFSSRSIVGDAPHSQNSLNRMNSHSGIPNDFGHPLTTSPNTTQYTYYSREEEGSVKQNPTNDYQPTDDDNSEGGSDSEITKEIDMYIDDDALRTELQKKFYYFFEEPTTLWAKAFTWFSSIIIVLTTVMVCVESVPTITWQQPFYFDFWITLDSTNVVIFFIDYFGRLYASTNKRKFVFGLTNVIDFVSIVPFFVQIVTFSTQIPVNSTFKLLRTPRLLRVIRLLQITKYRTGFIITYRVFVSSAYQIFIVFIFVLLIILVSSAIMWPIERGTLGSDDVYYRYNSNGVLEKSPFQSIIHSFWWSIATLTTTGYGDIVPVTPLGKLVAGLTMFCGILVIALPTSILGSNLVAEWTLHYRLQSQAKALMQAKQVQELKGFEHNKAKRFKALEESNETMLRAIVDIQDILANFNPPRYYHKYRDLKSTYLKACGRIHELEDKVERYKRFNKNLTRFNDLSPNNARRDDGHGDNNHGVPHSLTMNSIKLHKWKKQRTTDTMNSAGGVESSVSRGSKVSPISNTLRKIKIPFTRSSSREDSNAKPSGHARTSALSKEIISSPTEMRLGYTPIDDDVRHVSKEIVSKEIISSPTEMRPRCTPINDDERYGMPMVRSGSEPLYPRLTPHKPNSRDKKNKITKDSINFTRPVLTSADAKGVEQERWRRQSQDEISMVDGGEGSTSRGMSEINDGGEGSTDRGMLGINDRGEKNTNQGMTEIRDGNVDEIEIIVSRPKQ